MSKYEVFWKGDSKLLYPEWEVSDLRGFQPQ